MLKWARANDCPWDEDVRGAAEGGHLEVLQVGARERLPVGREDVLRAAEWRPPRDAEWARANGCPWDEWTCAACGVAATSRC